MMIVCMLNTCIFRRGERAKTSGPRELGRSTITSAHAHDGERNNYSQKKTISTKKHVEPKVICARRRVSSVACTPRRRRRRRRGWWVNIPTSLSRTRCV